jgi:hypothetical protein
MQFHMVHVKAIFDWIFGLDGASCKLYYLQSLNIGLSLEALHAHSEKEKTSLKTEQDFVKKCHSLMSVWSWINMQHDLYMANKLVEHGRGKHQPVSAEIKKSYGT